MAEWSSIVLDSWESISESFQLVSWQEVSIGGYSAYEAAFFNTFNSSDFAHLQLHLIVGEDRYIVEVTTSQSESEWQAQESLLKSLVRSFRPLQMPTVTPTPTIASVYSGGPIETCINGTFEGWSGDTVFDLCNGQVWIQSSYDYLYHYAYRPNVLIVSMAGGYEMFVEGVSDSIRVRRITDFMRTCISGDFDGFSYDTIFELCNGQIWQQTSFNISTNIRIRPDVLIYRNGSLYKMGVEGIDETVNVIRLR